MILRPRQKEFVDHSVEALKEHGNTLAIAPTGAGKSVMLSAVVGKMKSAKTLILAHRDELTSQNEAKFKRVNPQISTSVYDSKIKSWEGGAIFAMVQTLYRNLDKIPKLDLVVIDEAHHVVADTYKKIIDRVRELNSKAMIYG